MKLSEVVNKYIELRDKKSELKREYDAKVAGIDTVLDQIEAKLLEVFDSTGIESTRTEFGTAYISTRTSASVVDKDAFMEHVKRHGDWSLLEVRCSKTAVEQYRAANSDVPPGVNIRDERVVNVRRSA